MCLLLSKSTDLYKRYLADLAYVDLKSNFKRDLKVMIDLKFAVGEGGL